MEENGHVTIFIWISLNMIFSSHVYKYSIFSVLKEEMELTIKAEESCDYTTSQTGDLKKYEKLYYEGI